MKRLIAITLMAVASTLSLPAADVTIPDKDDLDVGLYLKTATGWVPLKSEVVNWKTGGVLKSMATYGIVKGDVNGHIQKAHSPNTVSATIAPAIEILIYAPEGVEPSDYQFLHLHEHSNDREFRTVTGGVFHASGDAQRDRLDFNATKVAKRMWTASLPVTAAGEYGFLAPGAAASSNAASLGKIYTLHVTE